MLALRDMPIKEWIEIAGLPTLVEIIGDTNIYYYNYRPTLYATTFYDSTTFFKTWGTAIEQKPSLANKTEVWGSRKDIIQIKVVKELVISAVITEGPDKKVLVRDLNGNIVLDPNSGYNPNISAEQKVNSSFKDFNKIFSSLHGILQPADSVAVVPPADSVSHPAETSVAHPAEIPAIHPTEAAAAHPVEVPATHPTEAVATHPAEVPATHPPIVHPSAK